MLKTIKKINKAIVVLSVTIGFLTLNALNNKVEAAVDYTSQVVIDDFDILDSNGTPLSTSNKAAVGGLYQLDLSWTLTPSGDVIHEGDTLTIPRPVNSITGTWSIANSAPVDFTGTDGTVIGQWQFSGAKIVVTFGANAEGLSSVSANFITGSNALSNQTVSATEVTQNVTIGGVSKEITFEARPLVPWLSNNLKSYGSSSNSQISWIGYVNINGLRELSTSPLGTTFTSQNDVFFEDVIEEGATILSVHFATRLQVPVDLVNYEVSTTNANSYALNSYFTLVSQNAGESYADFKARLAPLQYGIYIDDNGIETLAVNFGDIGNNGIKYSDLDPNFAANAATSAINAGYYSESDRAALESYYTTAYGDGNVIGGNVPVMTVSFPTEYEKVLVDTPKTNTAQLTINGVTENLSRTTTLKGNIGSTTVQSSMAGLYLYDEETGVLLEGGTFKLQYNNNGTWEDYTAAGTMTTNADGYLETPTLGAGDYRFVQLSPSSSDYNIPGSAGYDSGVGSVISAEFTINPVDSEGELVEVSNIKHRYDVIYAPGEHGLFANDEHLDIVVNSATPAYAGELGIDGNPLGEDGWEFIGWDITVSDTVTGTVTYTAMWRDASINDIVYILDGGTNSPNNPDTYEYGVGVPSFENPTREGYKFLGWYDEDGNLVTSISATDFGTKTLYARWELVETGMNNSIIIILVAIIFIAGSLRLKAGVRNR